MTSVPGGREVPPDAVLRACFPDTVVIHQYVDILTSRGIDHGLLGPREAPRIWTRHILNCAVIAPAFPAGASVCDLGSGAGLPGVVLALARPDLSVTLLEPMLRRVRFLTSVVADLGVANLVVRRGRAEDMVGDVVVDIVTARAVAPLDTLAAWSLPLLKPGGYLLAMKGRGAEAEIAGARATLARQGVTAVEIETYGEGVVEPVTTMVRIESGRPIGDS